jgi:hypothetical protein
MLVRARLSFAVVVQTDNDMKRKKTVVFSYLITNNKTINTLSTDTFFFFFPSHILSPHAFGTNKSIPEIDDVEKKTRNQSKHHFDRTIYL